LAALEREVSVTFGLERASSFTLGPVVVAEFS
jgi:hypothetical protein